MGIHLEEMGIVLFSCLLCLCTFLSCGSAAITKESPLLFGQTLSSPGGIYELGFFSPNNSKSQYVGIWFKKITPRVVVWVANRVKLITSPVANLTISRNGSLVLLGSRNNVVWSARKSPTANKWHAELLDTGNLVIVDDVSGKHLWQSFENPGDTMLPDSLLMYNLATGEKRVLTSWKSHTDPSPGNFILELTTQVPPQIASMRGSTLYKRSGPWAKTGFTGIPLMDDSYSSPFSLSQDVGHGTGQFSYLKRSSVLTRVIITSEGYLKTFRYNGTGWTLDYMTPANSCDLCRACGPFGLCVVSNPTKCECMKGFVPKYKEAWKRGNTTSGCFRRTELSCQANSSRNGTNVFYHMGNVKPPDLYQLINFVDSDGCQQACLRNCSCTAFAYITGIGCLLWSQELIDTVKYSTVGEVLSIRLASSELGRAERHFSIKTSFLVAFCSLTSFIVFILTAMWFLRFTILLSGKSLSWKQKNQDYCW